MKLLSRICVTSLVFLMLWVGFPAHSAQSDSDTDLRIAVFVVSDAELPLQTIEVATSFVVHQLSQQGNIMVIPSETLNAAQETAEVTINTHSTAEDISFILQAVGADRAVFIDILQYEATSGLELSSDGFDIVAELVIHEDESTIRMTISGDIAPSFLFTLLVLLSQQEAELALNALLYDANGHVLASTSEQQTTTMDQGGDVLARLIHQAVNTLILNF